jgi:hypothetical protein
MTKNVYSLDYKEIWVLSKGTSCNQKEISAQVAWNVLVAFLLPTGDLFEAPSSKW